MRINSAAHSYYEIRSILELEFKTYVRITAEYFIAKNLTGDYNYKHKV
jgi:hypothetical protein